MCDEVEEPSTREEFQARHWLITWNNPIMAEEELAEKLRNHPKLHSWSFQCEIAPKTGTVHYQVYLGFKTPIRNSLIDAILNTRAYWSTKAKNPHAAFLYCNKEDSRRSGPYRSDKMPKKPGQRTDLEEARELFDATDADTVQDEMPDTFARYPRFFERLEKRREKVDSKKMINKEVIIIYGESRKGKSQLARFEFNCTKIKYLNGYWAGYNGEKNVLIDEADGLVKQIPRDELLDLLDHWETYINIKGSYKVWRAERICLTSNYTPDEWLNFYDSAIYNRISKIYNITDDGPIEIPKETFVLQDQL